ncbi:MAG: ABC transporter ATP-binding protein [Thermaerobacter sp.]|nr:ABC transporter ATP-binding protein [Thermaerobacter sp.]
MEGVSLRGVSKRWRHTVGLRDLTIDIDPSQFVVLYGPRGSGKSVFCRLLVGVDRPSQGTIVMNGADVTHLAPIQRGVAYVPQTFALYPQFSVYDNIAYPLAIQGEKKAEIRGRVDQIALTLGITDILAKRPDQLSGGQKQRVAIAKGLVLNRRVYVLDDPLVGLDYKIRERLVEELRNLQESLDALFVYATSDPLEPLLLADHVVVLDQGRLVDQGPPADLYFTPNHVRTATLGYPAANVIAGRINQDQDRWRVLTPVCDIPIEVTAEVASDQEVLVAVRAEQFLLQEGPSGAAGSFDATVELEEDIGSERIVHLRANGQDLQAGFSDHKTALELGQTVRVATKTSAMRIFDQLSGRCVAVGAPGIEG